MTLLHVTADGETLYYSWNKVMGAQGSAVLPDMHPAGRTITSISVTGVFGPNTRVRFQVQ